MLADLIGDVIGGVLGDRLARAGLRRAWGRKAERGQVLCGLRLLSGAQPGISQHDWRIGEWSVTPGRMSLEGIQVTVLGIEADSDRPARSASCLLAVKTLRSSRSARRLPDLSGRI